MPTPRRHDAIAILLHLLDEAFDRQAWHGPNLRGALRGLSVRQSSWRPGRQRHSIWEIALHAAYWKYATRRRLTGAPRGSFGLTGSNWFAQPARPTASEWRQAVALLITEHRRLRAVVAALNPALLHSHPHGSSHSVLRLVAGVAAHDIYHAGQIQLLKRLAPR